MLHKKEEFEKFLGNKICKTTLSHHKEKRMEWRPIPGFKPYSVSDTGEVRNDHTDRVLIQTPNQQGISTVGLMRDGKQYRRSVAVLVAEAFIDPPEEDTESIFDTPIHLNGDKSNCDVENLAWRPRWFAVRYHKQFEDEHEGIITPIVDLDTHEIYDNSWIAAIENGLLEVEIVQSILRRTYVFPTFQEFEIVRE